MKKVIFPLAAVLMMTACSKSDLEDEMIFPDQVRNGTFEDIELATNYWTTIGEGSLGLSSDDQAFQGLHAMTISPIGCFEVDYNEPLNVEEGATYELSFATKITGYSAVCLAEFYLVLEQDGESILEVNIGQGTALDWDHSVLYVRMDSSSPVYLKIFAGSEMILLDQVQFKRISSL